MPETELRESGFAFNCRVRDNMGLRNLHTSWKKMPEARHDSISSELWIPMEDAVKRTGVSQKHLLDWARSGRIKKEKRGGVTYLWMADLVQLAPVKEDSGERVTAGSPEVVAPSISAELYAAPSLSMARKLGDEVREGLRKQEQMMGLIADLQGRISRGEEGRLDPKTARSLAMLENVFRSIHQQNERISLALAGQEQFLKDLSTGRDREERLQSRVEEVGRRLRDTLIAAVIVIAVGAALAVISLRGKDADIRDIKATMQNRLSEMRKDAEVREAAHREALTRMEADEAEREARHLRDLESLRKEQGDELRNREAAYFRDIETFRKDLGALVEEWRRLAPAIVSGTDAGLIPASTDGGGSPKISP